MIGGIRIGNDVKIGAGAVVCSDVPEGATVVSPQAQVLEQKSGTERTRAWIELDRAALAHNIDVLKRQLPAGCRLMPAVKANAYGHGAVLIAGQCSSLGIDAFCVASAKEGAELRRHQISGEILVLGYTDPADFWMLERYGLSQTVVDASYAESLNQYGKRLPVHVAVDTGMHRLGEDYRNIKGIQHIFSLENLIVEGMFTHLCAADSTDPADLAFTKKQAEALFWTAKELKKENGVSPKLSLLSSDGIFHYAEYGADYARPGIALYGVPGHRGKGAEWEAQLRPVLSLKAKVAAVRELEAGESAGYGRAYIAKEKRRLAVLSIGYADGLPRSLSNGAGFVLLHGKKAPIAGRICMDQTLVDVTDIPQTVQGDTAVLIGRWKEACISACDLAAQANTITNEILSRLGCRLERFWV